jgi:hypothetical protein
VTIHAGETLTVSTLMYDHDWGSADDIMCKGWHTYGPYTDAQLQVGQLEWDINNHTQGYYAFSNIGNAWNGNAACTLAYYAN